MQYLLRNKFNFFKILYKNDINNGISIIIDINFIETVINVTHGFDGDGKFFSIN
jgi:hypothetical protein